MSVGEYRFIRDLSIIVDIDSDVAIEARKTIQNSGI